MTQKRIYLDTETSGLDNKKHAIIELAFILEIDGEAVESHSWLMRPKKGKFVTKEALEVNGHSIEQIKTYEPEDVVFKRFIGLLDKYINKYDTDDKAYVYAYNAQFDLGFIEQWFKDNNNPYVFSYAHWPWISVDVLAAIYAEGQREKLGDFKLSTVCKALGIEVDEKKLHGGLYDVELTKRLYGLLEAYFKT